MNCGGASNIYVNGDNNILANNIQDTNRLILIGNNNVNKNNFSTETIYPNTLSAGWLNINNANKFGYSLDNGNVSLSGTLKSGNFNQLLFTLPLGFRPENGKNYSFLTSAGNSGETATVSINYLGDIYITQTNPLGKNDSISFEGVRFKV